MDLPEELLVSIIIPVYNVRPYLEESLSSVINQTYRNLEILIIDDGSTDGSWVICDAFQKKDPRIRLFHQENRGLSAARNVGLDHMTGDLVAFIDPDDTFHPDMIRIMVKSSLLNRAEIAVCKSTSDETLKEMAFSERGSSGNSEQNLLSSADSLRLLIDRKIGHAVWNKLYDQGIWNQIRFPEGYVYEDIRTTYRLLEKAERIIFLNRILVFHRVRPGSITATYSLKHLQDWLLANDEIAQFVCDHTPELFSEKQKARLLESKFRTSMIKLSELIGEVGDQYRNKLAFIQKEILKKEKENHYFSIKSDAVGMFQKLCKLN